jgi:hypothetical protein
MSINVSRCIIVAVISNKLESIERFESTRFKLDTIKETNTVKIPNPVINIIQAGNLPILEVRIFESLDIPVWDDSSWGDD